MGNHVLYEFWSSIVSALKIKTRVIFAVKPPNEVQPTKRSKPCKASEHWTLFINIGKLLTVHTFVCTGHTLKKKKRTYASEKEKSMNSMVLKMSLLPQVCC